MNINTNYASTASYIDKAPMNPIQNSERFENALWDAAFSNDSYGLQNLLDNTPHINLEITNIMGQTPLEVAANYNNYDVVNTLLEAGARWDKPLTSGETLLGKATVAGKTETVGRLLEYGANANETTGGYRETLLHTAVKNNDFEMTKLLISYYASADVVSSWSYFGVSGTPLHYALKNKNLPITSFLVSVGANLNLPNEWGEHPLHVAAHYGASYNSLHELVQAGAYIDAISPCSNGTTPGTPFHVAIGRGNVKAAKFLVELGCDYTLLNPSGKNAMQIAQEKGNYGAMRYLESLGFHAV